MMTFNQFKSGMIAMMLLLANWANAQSFWSTDFGDQAAATTNWVTTGSMNTGAVQWAWTNNLNAGYQDQQGTFGVFTAPTAANGYFLFDSDANGYEHHDARLTGPATPINCTGKSDIHLRFFAEYAHFTDTLPATESKLSVGMSTNGTDFTYTEVLASLAPNAIFENIVDVELPGASNQAQVWIQFRWEGTFEYHLKIDDVELVEVPPAMPQVTFRVNMANQTVDPGGVFLAGSFNGWSNEAMTSAGGGVYTLTKTLTQGQAYQYKFKNGANGWENNPDLVVCGINDGSGNINRLYTAGTADETLTAVCFNSCTPCILTCAQNPNAIICEDFDGMTTAQGVVAQSPTNWALWPGGNATWDGAIVTTTAASAPNALRVIATAAAGGPMDILLRLQNKTTGNYSLKWKMNIPAGKQGYYNMQNVVPFTTGAWNFDIFFNNGGEGDLQVGQVSQRTFSFPYDTWFTVEHRIDLDNNLMELWVNGSQVGTIAYPNNIGGINFFGIDNTHQYFVDDLEYVQLAPVVFNADNCANAINLNPFIGLAAGVLSTSGPHDITNATVAPTDPNFGTECQIVQGTTLDPLHGTHWFTFTGDGNRYLIRSKACGTTPMPTSDTQFALYSGSCGNFTAVACNDDENLAGNQFNSLFNILTVPGTVYYLMVDSWGGENGEYCLDITQVGNIDCAQGEVGTNTVSNNGQICWEGNLNEVISVEANTYVIPNTLPGVSGHLWCITSAPLDPMTWPGTVPGIASTGASPNVAVLGLPNDGSTSFTPGVYYLTSVVVAGGSLIDPAGIARVFNIDVANGCFFIGTSHQITLLPQINPITITSSIINATDPGWNGRVNLTVSGGSSPVVGEPYQYLWSNGTTGKDLIDVAPGTYTVTIIEPTGCVPNGTGTYTVGGFVSSTNDPAVISNFSLTPNPTTGLISVRIELANSVEVRVDVINAIGQVVVSRHLGNTNQVSQDLDLSNLADGTYFLRTTLDNEVAIRTVVVTK